MSANKTAVAPTIESEEFYELMQAYRFANPLNQRVVAEHFGAIVAHVDARLAAHDDLVKALQRLTETCGAPNFICNAPTLIADDLEFASNALSKAGA